MTSQKTCLVSEAQPQQHQDAADGQAVLGSQTTVGPVVAQRLLHHYYASIVAHEARLRGGRNGVVKQ